MNGQRLGLYIVILTYVFVLVITSHDAHKDYYAYENAAVALIQGKDIYVGTRYNLNFPLIAECISWMYKWVHAVIFQINPALSNICALKSVFYIFQCLQLTMIGLGYWLCCNWLIALGLTQKRSSIISGALWLLSFPIYLVVKKSQVDLIMLDLTLLSLLFVDLNPILAGLSLAAGSFIKIYPIAVVIAAIISNRRKFVAAFAVGLLVMLVIQTMMGGIGIWSQYFLAIREFHIANPFVDFELQKEPCIANAVLSSYRILAPGYLVANQMAIQSISFLVGTLILFFFGWRIWLRERNYRQRAFLSSAALIGLERARFYGHVADLLSAGLLISPHVWSYHYVMAYPVILLSIASRRRITPLSFAGIVFILSWNPFEFGSTAYLLLSFLKPIGLVLLVVSAQIPKVNFDMKASVEQS